MISRHVAAALFLAFAAAGPARADLPSGMVFFTDQTSCPTGSSAYAEAEGRLLMVAPLPGTEGRTLGTPFTAAEDLTHDHNIAVGINLPSLHVAGISGCCNKNVAGHGNHFDTATTTAVTTDLPFLMLLTCVAD